VWVPGELVSRTTRRSAPWLDVIGFGALAALFGFYRWLDEFQPFSTEAVLYRSRSSRLCDRCGRPSPCAPASAPVGAEGTVLDRAAVVWHLSVHWPVFMVTRPQLDVLITGLPLLVLRLAVTGVLAELSVSLCRDAHPHGRTGTHLESLARGARHPALAAWRPVGRSRWGNRGTLHRDQCICGKRSTTGTTRLPLRRVN